MPAALLFLFKKLYLCRDYPHVLPKLISGIIVSAFLKTIYFNNQTIYNFKPKYREAPVV